MTPRPKLTPLNPRLKLLLAGLLAVGAAAWGAAPAAAAEPEILSVWVTDVTSTSANLRAEIDPGGTSTHYRFEYLTEAAYQADLGAGGDGFGDAATAPATGFAPAGAGSGAVAVVQHVGGLSSETTYRYRLVATNSAGTVSSSAHSFGTEAPTNVFVPLDQRGWELVSPVDKGGGAVAAPEQLFGGGVFQAAGAGGEVTYSSSTSFASGLSAPGGSQYLSRRGSGGWSTENITGPAVSGSYGDRPDGTPYRLFSDDLSTALMLNGARCRGAAGSCPVANPPISGSGAVGGYQTFYLRDDRSGSFTSLLTQGDISWSGLSASQFAVALAGSDAHLSAVVISSCAALTADAVEVPAADGCDAAAQNLYLWNAGSLRLVNLLPGDDEGTPGTTLAAPSGAISDEGNRIYWVDSSGRLYLAEGGQGKPVDQSGEAEFQVASGDGSVAYFLRSGHLFRYRAETEAAADLTPAGGVLGVLGAASDGSAVYYADSSGLFEWNGGTTTEVAAGTAAASSSDYPPATGTARVSADGRHLLFLSAAELSGYDPSGASELYLYGPAANGGSASLTCVSCNPAGERPRGSASIPGAVANGSTAIYKPRVLASDARRVFFDSDDVLSIQDTNNRGDVYEWEAAGEGTCTRTPGCIQLISSGRSPEPSAFVDASASGADVFFLTDESLVPNDPGSIDLYDAREGGGFPVAPAPIPCNGDACQPLPEAPEDPTPGTLVPGSGNPPLRFPKTKPKHRNKHKHKKRHRHHKRKGAHNGGHPHHGSGRGQRR